jgi:hypothetical protein
MISGCSQHSLNDNPLDPEFPVKHELEALQESGMVTYKDLAGTVKELTDLELISRIVDTLGKGIYKGDKHPERNTGGAILGELVFYRGSEAIKVMLYHDYYWYNDRVYDLDPEGVNLITGFFKEPDVVTKKMLSGIPDSAFPFPKEQAFQSWEIDDKYILIEQVDNRDHSFFLYTMSSGDMKCIVDYIENATYKGQKREHISFIARDGADTDNFDFPYRLNYNLATGELLKNKIFLPLEQPVAFGKYGWRQVLNKVQANGSEITFEFVPREDEVLAGGHNRPLTTIYTREESGELIIHFYSVEIGEELKKHFSGTSGFAISITPRVGERLPFIQFAVEEISGVKPDKGEVAILTEGFPYGLALFLEERFVEDNSVLVRIILDKAESYSVETLLTRENDGKSIVKYVLKFN